MNDRDHCEICLDHSHRYEKGCRGGGGGRRFFLEGHFALTDSGMATRQITSDICDDNE